MLDKVVAVVGGSSILYSEVDEYARQLTAQRRAEGYTSDRNPHNEALEALLTQKLLYNQALIDSVEVNTADLVSRVDEQVSMMAEEAGGIAELEARQHMAIFNIREVMRRRYEEQAYAQAMQGQVVSRVKVIPGEVERFYKKIDRDSLPIIPEQYVYAQITRFPKSMVQAKQRAKERLLEMRERIIRGDAKFENLARMYSQDGTAIRGGEMPPMRLNELDPSFAAALEKLRPGQISEVTESQFRIPHHPVDRQTRQRLPLPAHSGQTRLYAGGARGFAPYARQPRAAGAGRFDHFRKGCARLLGRRPLEDERRHRVEPRHPRTLERDGCPLHADGLFKEDFGRYRKMDDYNALQRLKVGGISDAFLTQDIAGNELAKVVKLVEVIPTHTAELGKDYLRLEEMALQAKQERVFEEWLTKKIDGMYVFIAPNTATGSSGTNIGSNKPSGCANCFR